MGEFINGSTTSGAYKKTRKIRELNNTR
jgi:hypothetical protein